jgi:antitoxin component YwqK of YwqJK toxin-antitoxin module
MNNKSIIPRNKKGERHGLWVRYYGDGTLWYRSFFHNGKRVGYDEEYLSPYGKTCKSSKMRYNI